MSVERWITGFLVIDGLVHTTSGHSDTTGCVRWLETTYCGRDTTNKYISSPREARVVTCLKCLSREPARRS